MKPPDSLPGRLFLLAYDLNKQRMTARDRLGYILRGAALTELYLDGRLTGDKRPQAATDGDDPYGIRGQIAGSRARSWQYWVRKDNRKMVATVRAELAAGGWIRVEFRRRFGIFPCHRVTVRDPRVVKNLWGGASSALHGRPVARVHSYDAATVALAAAGGLRTVLPRADRRRHRRRIAELTARSGPAVPAVHKAVQTDHLAATSG
ncbi:GPP34 family phosphoprotein [Actinomadura craniellae]|uniref:GPP34 family phosphoprotein n=1 Tax=Actinomadura craniellae TaxID=2231787 RepID=A0A365HC00_9ACTN|nr:GPP34 family phosphoprotein [Actinomadura craniellae]RAY16635.1 GPP34 family phosphoprotein [Actinomadura craniellae]